MPEREVGGWLSTVFPWISTLVLSFWAGVVQYIEKVRRGKRWNWRELSFDLIICTFVGLLTHLLCLWANIEGALMAVLTAISAHMGTRAIAGMERFRNRIFGIDVDAGEGGAGRG